MEKSEALLLLSGGIDSPIAGFLTLKNKIGLSAVHFSTEKFTGKESIEKAQKLCKLIGIRKLFIADTSTAFEEISKKTEHKLYFVITKRLMFRAAERIAEKNGMQFLVSGENIGQVSSQTLSNLTVIDRAVSIPVIRPLLSLDKMQIVAIASSTGSFEISKGPEMCDYLEPKHPATKATEEWVKKEEEKLNIDQLVQEMLSNLQEKEIS